MIVLHEDAVYIFLSPIVSKICALFPHVSIFSSSLHLLRRRDGSS